MISLKENERKTIEGTLAIVDGAYLPSSERANKKTLVEYFYQNLNTLTNKQIKYLEEYVKGNPWEKDFRKMIIEYYEAYNKYEAFI